MHSAIFQLSEQPILEPNLLEEDDIPEWFINLNADYFRKVTGNEMGNWLDSLNYDDMTGRVTFTKEEIEHQFKWRSQMFKNCLNHLNQTLEDNPQTFFWENKAAVQSTLRTLQNIYDDQSDFWIYHEDYGLITFNSFLRNVYEHLINEKESEQSFFVGTVFDYHF